MISYWKKTKEIYNDCGFALIIGWYDHKNENSGGEKAFGAHWGEYPQSRGQLSPCVIPETTRNVILSGLLQQAVMSGNVAQVESIMEAIKFFKD